MKCYALLALFCLPILAAGQSAALYDDNRVSRIFLDLPQDSLDVMIQNLVNDRYFPARFIFDDGTHRDTIPDAGLRLRGNTSLTAQKKSFKVSFNAFKAGRSYQGVKKLNLRGSHNDPTMIREKLFYEVWNKAGMPRRRAAFAELYINGSYRGLYTNIEEIDKEWLADAYGDNDGNLYKCTWPANLAYLGPNPEPYKAVLNNPETRAYDLVTNESDDDYTRLVALIAALNQPVNAIFPQQISAILDINDVLKAYAIDVATGNWDDYFYNQNNYYLYDNPQTKRFEFVTFDTDNTFGVDWLGKDWAKRNAMIWYQPGVPRPLATQLLAVPAFQQKFVHHLDSITRYITHPDSIFPRIDALHALITPAAQADYYRILDYGYDAADFHNGFSKTVDSHTPYGIKPFLSTRYVQTLSQIAPYVGAATPPTRPAPAARIFPNPTAAALSIQLENDAWSQPIRVELSDCTGRMLGEWDWQPGLTTLTLPVGQFADGVYFLQLRARDWESSCRFIKCRE